MSLKQKTEAIMEKAQIECLKQNSDRIRLSVIRGTYFAKSGHPGGSLSIADLLSYLYFAEMHVDPADPRSDNRDRLVLSKGHAAPALYGALALRGFFPVSDIDTLRRADSYLQGHPDMKGTPGVDMSTGSLGQGISAACGMALSAKLSDKKYNVFAVLGDGELEEGQVWEAAMFASHYGLSNLCAFIDLNGLQIDGTTAEVMNSAPVDDKFRAFGWNTLVINGHDFEDIDRAVSAFHTERKRPTAVIMNTVKGKGVSFMEGKCSWHGKAPVKEEFDAACAEISARLGKEGE